MLMGWNYGSKRLKQLNLYITAFGKYKKINDECTVQFQYNLMWSCPHTQKKVYF